MSNLFEPNISFEQEEENFTVSVSVRVPKNYEFEQLGLASSITEDYQPKPAGIAVQLVFAMRNTSLEESDNSESIELSGRTRINAAKNDVVRVDTWASNYATAAKRKKGDKDKEIK